MHKKYCMKISLLFVYSKSWHLRYCTQTCAGENSSHSDLWPLVMWWHILKLAKHSYHYADKGHVHAACIIVSLHTFYVPTINTLDTAHIHHTLHTTVTMAIATLVTIATENYHGNIQNSTDNSYHANIEAKSHHSFPHILTHFHSHIQGKYSICEPFGLN